MKLKGSIYVTIAAILWGIVSLFARHFNALGFDAFQYSFLKCIVASIAILLFILLYKKSDMRIKHPLHLIYFVFTGIIGTAFCYVSYYLTMRVATLQVASILLYCAPFIVLILAFFLFKEKITRTKAAALIISVIGCALITGIYNPEALSGFSTAGILTGLGSALAYAIYSIASRFALKHYDAFTTTAYTFIFATLGMLPFISLNETAGMLIAQPISIVYAITIGIFCTVVPYTLYVYALNFIEIGKASILTFVEPMVQTVVGIIFFKEALTISSGFAILLIFIAVVMLNWDEIRKSSTVQRE